MDIVIVGHVDHGKSTVVGRLFADTHSLPEGRLEQVRENCRRQSRPFEYAFLVDTLKDERQQGITIDAARTFFKGRERDYIIIDAPGHLEFLKNMVTGASRAEAALLVIDAQEGIQENSRRHGYMLSMLGIKQVVVLINKMDLTGYDETAFRAIVRDYGQFLQKINIAPRFFIPGSGMQGDNIVAHSKNMSWHNGPTVLEALDSLETAESDDDHPFRMPVQGVYKFTGYGDNRRVVAGTIESGILSAGDKVIFYPSGKKSTVGSIEAFHDTKTSRLTSGYAAAFTLTEQIYITRGELACLDHQERPRISSRMRVNLFWLGKEPMVKKKSYFLKIGMMKTEATLEDIVRVIDASTLENALKHQIERHDVAEVILKTDKAIAFDIVAKFLKTSRFVIVDDYEIAGGGIVQEALEDEQSRIREKVMLRNYKWEGSAISSERRAEKYNQKAVLILITGKKGAGRRRLAKMLEETLFADGKSVYFLKLGNMLYGVDADINDKSGQREEHLRRLAEIAHIMLDAGMILIVTAQELTQNDLENIKTIVDPDMLETIWLGEHVTTDMTPDLHIPLVESDATAVAIIKEMLQKKGLIFRPW